MLIIQFRASDKNFRLIWGPNLKGQPMFLDVKYQLFQIYFFLVLYVFFLKIFMKKRYLRSKANFVKTKVENLTSTFSGLSELPGRRLDKIK